MVLKTAEEISSRWVMEAIQIHEDGSPYDSIECSNLRYLPENDSKNDAESVGRVIGRGVIDMILVGGLR
jgi:hypothetical protein